MEIDLISRLNTQIATIDPKTIQEHISKGDLDNWIANWRIEIAATSFALFMQMREWEQLKQNLK